MNLVHIYNLHGDHSFFDSNVIWVVSQLILYVVMHAACVTHDVIVFVCSFSTIIVYILIISVKWFFINDACKNVIKDILRKPSKNTWIKKLHIGKETPYSLIPYPNQLSLTSAYSFSPFLIFASPPSFFPNNIVSSFSSLSLFAP